MRLGLRAIALLMFVAVAAPVAAQTLRVTAATTNLRAKPAAEADIVAPLTKGAELEVVGKEGAWYRVRVKSSGAEGFVHSLVVETIAGAAPVPTPTPQTRPPAEPASGSQPSSQPTPAVQAVTAAPSAIAVGLKGGFNVAHLVENTEGLDSKTGLILGGFVRRSIGDWLSLQPEFLFSQQGAAVRDVSLRLNYLQIPVLGVASFGREASTRPFVLAGPAIGFTLSATVMADGDSEDVSNDVSGGDFSFVIGGGVETNKFLLDARYAIGLKDVDPGRDIDKNRVFSILVGYRLR